MSNFAVYNSNGKYPGEPISVEDKQKHLYHYTKLQSFVKIWYSRSLLFSPAKNMNDILENSKKLSANCFDKKYFDNYRKIVDSYKQISLTMDYDSYRRGSMSTMMWGHYADSGNGVCIELDPEKLRLEDTFHGPVNYCNFIPRTPVLPRGMRDSDIEQFILNNKDSFYFSKSDDWQGENEYRIIGKSHEKLDISEAIVAIYVTSAYSDTCKCVEDLVGDIPVYFFHHNETSKIQVPIVSSTKKYRESMIPKKEKESIIFKGENSQITQRTYNAKGELISEETIYGALTITPCKN